MRKKILVISLATVLVLSMASCKKSDDKQNNDTPQQSTTNYWDGIEIIEGDGEGSVETTSEAGGDSIQFVTDENGGDVIIVDGFGDDEPASNSEGNTVEATTKKNNNSNKNNNNNNNNNNNSNNNDGDVITDIEEGNSNNSGNTGNGGQTESEAYPGQNEGWSPIVRPEDLNGN